MGSPALSRLGVWRDLEIQNRVTKYCTQNRIGGGEESGGTRTGGRYMLQVDSDWRDGGGYVVYGSGDDDGGIWQR